MKKPNEAGETKGERRSTYEQHKSTDENDHGNTGNDGCAGVVHHIFSTKHERVAVQGIGDHGDR